MGNINFIEELRFFYYCLYSIIKNALIQNRSGAGGCVMDCHATTWGSIPGGEGVKPELHVLRKGQ